ncbi:MAG TPA: GNAT family N-acetyltransferase [Streptosporangiaceae bacterium]|nr:GNAT family N-acetyltransferase [Streptosporangiaceae bacterium]
MAGQNVVRADYDDIELLSHLIADACHDLPASRWLVSSPGLRRRIFPRYFTLHVEHAMTDGVVYTTHARDAAALWHPVGDEPADPLPWSEQRLAGVTRPWTSQFLAFETTLSSHHPAGVPHQYLAILAVRPGRQGRGIGSKLLRAHHATLDSGRVPAYAEAASTLSRNLYLRHGYTERPGGSFRVPHGPIVWPMWREPAPASTLRDSGERPGQPLAEGTCGAGPGAAISADRPGM